MTNEDEIAGNEETNHPTHLCSKEASDKLVRFGYTNIVEFGGILDWTGEDVKRGDNDDKR